METDADMIMESGRRAFYALREQARKNGIQDMSMDEINEEIREARYGEEQAWSRG